MSDDVDFEALAKLGPTAQNYEHARTLLRGGASFSEIRWQLSRQGLKAEFVETVVTELAIELIHPLVVAGVSADKIRERLALRGLSDQDASAIMMAATAPRATNRRSGGLASLVAWFGNITGL